MMAATHDYKVKLVQVMHLDATHVLVGESGGLCAVYSSAPSGFGWGLWGVETEHGMLLLDPDAMVEVHDG